MLMLDRVSLDLWQQSKVHPCNILGNNYPPDRLISFVVCSGSNFRTVQLN